MSEAKAQAEAAKKRQLPPKEAALFKELLVSRGLCWVHFLHSVRMAAAPDIDVEV